MKKGLKLFIKHCVMKKAEFSNVKDFDKLGHEFGSCDLFFTEKCAILSRATKVSFSRLRPKRDRFVSLCNILLSRRNEETSRAVRIDFHRITLVQLISFLSFLDF